MKKKLHIMIIIAGLCTNAAFAQSLSLLTPPDVTTSINVRVTVAKKARLELLNSQRAIEVSPADLERGYVDIPRAIALELWCNSVDGSVVETELTGEIYDRNGYRFPRGLLMYKLPEQREYQAFGSSPQILYQSQGVERGNPLTVDLRLLITSKMAPGEYYYQASFTALPI